jgi:hypothetical protein
VSGYCWLIWKYDFYLEGNGDYVAIIKDGSTCDGAWNSLMSGSATSGAGISFGLVCLQFVTRDFIEIDMPILEEIGTVGM